MSGDLTQALRTAHSGLFTSQQALDAVARNVANVNTPGYSRKIVNLEQRTLAGAGAGVDFGVLSRRIDQGLLDSLRQETGGLHASNIRSDMLDRIQALFGTPESDSSLSHVLTDFQTALESLAAAPQDGLGQREVVRAGADAASLLRRYSNGIQDLRAEADQRIGKAVEEINGLLAEVADLNDKIVRNQAAAHSVADLQDARDQAVDRLSQLIDVRAVGRGNGAIVVFTAGGRTLVDGTAASLSHIPAVVADASVNYAEGDFDGIYVGDRTAGNDMTGGIRSGELSGLIDMRDSVLPDLQSTLDTLAAKLRDTVNAVHNRGAAFPGLVSMSGSRVFTDPASQTITFDGTSDTALVLFDGNGNQVGRTMVRAELASGGFPASPTAADLVAAIDGSLGGKLSAAIIDGKMTLSVTAPGLTLAIRDQATSDPRDGWQDAEIKFNADGDAANTIEETVFGFSSFFGLNDFFTDQASADQTGRLVVGFCFEHRGPPRHRCRPESRLAWCRAVGRQSRAAWHVRRERGRRYRRSADGRGPLGERRLRLGRSAGGDERRACRLRGIADQRCFGARRRNR